MSLESGALIIALLWGPTLLYLVFRAARGPANRGPDPFAGNGEAADSAASGQGTILGYWLCRSCRSANRLADRRCYGCRAERSAVDLLAPIPAPADPQPAGNGWVPVMDPAPRFAALADVSAHSFTAAPGVEPDGPPSDPEPAVAAAPATASRARRRARSTMVAGVATGPAVLAEVPLATSASLAAAVASPAAVATPAAVAVPQTSRSAPPVCPFLGLKGDPATRFDYPDQRNLCHAATAGGAKALPVLQRLKPLTTGAKAVPIDPAHQASLCLTADHEQCARYPVAVPIAGEVANGDPGRRS